MFIQISEQGVKEGFRRHHPQRLWKQRVVELSEERENGEILWSQDRSETEKIALSAQRNSHPIAHELLVKCKCIPQQPRNKQAATSLVYN